MTNTINFNKLSDNSFELKEQYTNTFRKFRNNFILDVFKLELKNNPKLELVMHSDGIQRYTDLTGDYYLSFSNNNIKEEDLKPLFYKKIDILKSAIKDEIDLLKIKIDNLEEYIQFLIKQEDQNLLKKENFNFTVVNSFGEDVTNKKIDKDYIEYTLKYLYNFLTKSKEYDLTKLNYHSKYLTKIKKDIHNAEFYTEDFFINGTDILSYERVVYPDLLEVKDFYLGEQLYYNKMKTDFLEEDGEIKLLAPIVTTLQYIENQVKFSKDNKDKDFFDKDEVDNLQKDIKKIKKGNVYTIIDGYIHLKDSFNLQSLEDSMIELLLLENKFNKKEIERIKGLVVTTKITFGNYKY